MKVVLTGRAFALLAAAGLWMLSGSASAQISQGTAPAGQTEHPEKIRDAAETQGDDATDLEQEGEVKMVILEQNPYRYNHSFYYPSYFAGGYYDRNQRPGPADPGRVHTGGYHYIHRAYSEDSPYYSRYSEANRLTVATPQASTDQQVEAPLN